MSASDFAIGVASILDLSGRLVRQRGQEIDSKADEEKSLALREFDNLVDLLSRYPAGENDFTDGSERRRVHDLNQEITEAQLEEAIEKYAVIRDTRDRGLLRPSRSSSSELRSPATRRIGGAGGGSDPRRLFQSLSRWQLVALISLVIALFAVAAQVYLLLVQR